MLLFWMSIAAVEASRPLPLVASVPVETTVFPV